MPSIRIGFASDFTLKNQLVGVGTTTAAYKLNVSETIKGDFEVSGVTTLTSYSGFIPQKQNVSTASTIGFNTTGIGTVGITSFISVNEAETGFISLTGEFNTLSEDLIIDDGKILDVSTTTNIGITTIGTQSVYVPTNTTVSLGTLESLNIASHFSVPNGGINSRQQHHVEGMVRFNDDLNTLEFYNGVEWRQFTVDGSSGRAVFGAGDNYQTLNIHSTGNAQYFGNSITNTEIRGAFGSETRGVWGGGVINSPTPSTFVNAMEYVTLASSGNAINFGNLSVAEFRNTGGCSSSTRGIFFAGGHPTYFNSIHYIQINTLGNSLDFGDQTTSAAVKTSFSSPTRGFAMGGFPVFSATIDVITIASTGNAIKFGDMGLQTTSMGGFANSIRGVYGGGYGPGSIINNSNHIEYITMSTLGNAIDFGDLTQGRRHSGGTASQTRGIFFGGYVPSPGSGNQNVIDYITIASTGNAIDFGDAISAQQRMRGTSDSHGGLGGF